MAEHTHHFEPAEMEEWYQFTPERRRRFVTGIVIGLALLVVGAFLVSKGWGIGLEHAHEAGGHAHGAHEGAEHHETAGWLKRVIANLWLNSVLFTGIAGVGMFFVAIQYLSWAGWSSIIKRIPEAFPAFLPFSLVLLLGLFLLFKHDLFHWTHESLYDKASPDYDPIIAGKRGFLNQPFYLIRMVFSIGAWYVLWRMLRNASIREDEIGGTEHWYRMKNISRVFILVFAVTSSTSAWDWVMSIDTHWFSTMFGWYLFASWHVTTLAVIALVVMYLQDQGYLRWVNESHLHDLGKYIFAFSIFWTYVWFAQFLLIYYANLPEEIIYFKERFTGYGGIYKAPFFINFFLCFVFPFLSLMTRDAKRTPVFMKVACWGVVVGHWFDFYQMIMPGAVGANGGFGLIEFGTILLFASAFAYVVNTQLAKVSLVAKNHPMLEEAVQHDI
jgi:hypothetical protein